MCVIRNHPTLKASNSEETITLPGRVQLFRGSDVHGNYVGDVIGLDSEEVEIDGAVKVERLLLPFWENGQHSSIPSINKQKVFVEEQRARFRDINNYPCVLSDQLRKLRDNLVASFKVDNSGWQSILKVPER
jgi:hypothetical protein